MSKRERSWRWEQSEENATLESLRDVAALLAISLLLLVLNYWAEIAAGFVVMGRAL
jgi:hypothetical protein